MCNNDQLLIANGMKKWPNSRRCTCYTTSRQSVIDYLLISLETTKNIMYFYIKELQLESGHCPLRVNMKWDSRTKPPTQNKETTTKRIFDYKKAPSYAAAVEACLKNQNNMSWETFLRTL
jgi:hypothetical protein